MIVPDIIGHQDNAPGDDSDDAHDVTTDHCPGATLSTEQLGTWTWEYGSGDGCLCVRHSHQPRVTRMGLVMPRDNISIIETLGPLSAESMRPSSSRTPHLSILRWLGRGAGCSSHWSLTRQPGLWLVHQRPGGWSGSGGWWWPDYEYSVSITNGGKKPSRVSWPDTNTPESQLETPPVNGDDFGLLDDSFFPY